MPLTRFFESALISETWRAAPTGIFELPKKCKALTLVIPKGRGRMTAQVKGPREEPMSAIKKLKLAA